MKKFIVGFIAGAAVALGFISWLGEEIAEEWDD